VQFRLFNCKDNVLSFSVICSEISLANSVKLRNYRYQLGITKSDICYILKVGLANTPNFYANVACAGLFNVKRMPTSAY